jgi:catechol-2,3-dioxygenase
MSTTPRIASLGHVGIFVEDVERSLVFYRDLLGLYVTDADVANGMYFLSSRPDEEHHEFLICRGRTAPRDARLIQQVSFRCATFEDVIAYWQRFKARQTILAPIDLSRPVADLLSDIKACVEAYGSTGYVDPVLLRN